MQEVLMHYSNQIELKMIFSSLSTIYGISNKKEYNKSLPSGRLFYLPLFKVIRLQKHIASVLLLVFTFGVIPAPLLHEFFANHTDVADNHCHYYHKDLGKHVEEQQNHCSVFKADTPLYDVLKVEHDFSLSITIVSEFKLRAIFACSFAKRSITPSRAPPSA